MHLSICVSTTPGRIQLLDVLLGSLANQTLVPPGTEIILLAVHALEDRERLQRIINTHRQTLRKRRTTVTVHYTADRVTAAKARNTLVRLAKGTHLLFIDDDDVANPRMVELFVGAARLTDADVLTGFAEDFEADLQQPHMLSLSLGAAVESMMLLHYAGKSNMVVRKRAMQDVGGCTEDSVDSVDTPFVDWDLYEKLLASGATMAVIPEPTFYYRTRSLNSIYHNAVSNPDLIFYAHHKRATSFCKINNVPPIACVGIAYVVQALARPNSITNA
jgi:glycosyltransferase involved in cell wall biosynthesis